MLLSYRPDLSLWLKSTVCKCPVLQSEDLFIGDHIITFIL